VATLEIKVVLQEQVHQRPGILQRGGHTKYRCWRLHDKSTSAHVVYIQKDLAASSRSVIMPDEEFARYEIF